MKKICFVCSSVARWPQVCGLLSPFLGSSGSFIVWWEFCLAGGGQSWERRIEGLVVSSLLFDVFVMKVAQLEDFSWFRGACS